MDWLDLLAVQGTLKSLLQHHSSKASILQRSAFFTVQLSHPHMTTGKTIALTRWTFVGKVVSLLFNMLSRLGKHYSTIHSFLFINQQIGVQRSQIHCHGHQACESQSQNLNQRLKCLLCELRVDEENMESSGCKKVSSNQCGHWTYQVVVALLPSGQGLSQAGNIKFSWQIYTIKCQLMYFNNSQYLCTLGWEWQFGELKSPAPILGEKSVSAIFRAEGEKKKIMTLTIASISPVLYSLYRMLLCST